MVEGECHCVVLTYKQAHALLIYMSRVGLTHTRTFAQATRSLLALVGFPAGACGVWKK